MESRNKLSVLQRSSNQTGWHKSNHFTPDQINSIKVFASKNDKSLNAIPSPLARIHLFDSAFSLVYQDESQSENKAGDVYRKLVSDCFDVFELVYNWNAHIRDGKKLEIVSWNRDAETEKLKRIFNEELASLKKKKAEDIQIQDVKGYKHSLLANTLNLFLKQSSFANFDSIQILKLDDQPIAGSSPYTGFFTTPNDLTKIKLSNPTNDKKPYFSNTRLFNERRPEIKKFIYSFFVETGSEIFNTKLPIRQYLEFHAANVDDSLSLNLDVIQANEKQILGAIELTSNKDRGVNDFFEPYLVRANFKLNDDCFYTARVKGSTTSRDYLLPLTEAFFKEYSLDEIPSIISIDEKKFKNTRNEDQFTVDVTLKKGNISLTKTYQSNKIDNHDGQIIDLKENFSAQFNMAIFPFLKVTHNETGINFNDYYRLMFVCDDANFTCGNNAYQLKFGKGNGLINPEEATTYKIHRENRTILDRDKAMVGSTYYSTNFCFDFIQLQLNKFSDSTVKCMIVPKWKEKELKSKQMDFAIDFGTTTTFVAYVDPNTKRLPKPFSLDQEQLPVALLNKPKKKEPQFRWIDCFESFSYRDFDNCFEVQKQEFVPSIIDNEEYGFPFRTSVYERKTSPAAKISLVNSNISFSYQRSYDRATELFNNYITNLKWNVKTDDKYKESIKVFVEELLQLLKLKALLNECDPRKSNISWFSPLSFTPGAQFEYDQIWKSKYKEIFKGEPANHLKNVTESEAPFYYYSKGDVSGVEKIAETSSVVTLDIGGGTTDIMYFRDNIPKIGTSVHFGANVLWGDGYSEFTDTKNNGIYNALKSTIADKLKPTELKALNERLMNSDSEFGSDEIINFWILNNDKSHVLEELNRGAFKLSYLLHLSSLVYHSCRLIKHGSHPAPKCFVFTGNGSRYLDLIQNKQYVAKICGYFVKAIFYSDVKGTGPDIVPQIILPERDRKEATCFGGLYQPFDTGRQFETLNYLGFETTNEKFKKYSEIDIRKEIVFDKLTDSFSDFVNCFFGMNDVTDLSFRSHFAIETNLTAIKNFILLKARENLESGYTMRRKSVSADDEITDSLFFYPLVELLYRINKLTKEKLNEYIPRTVIYALNPDSDISFNISRLSPDRKADSIFAITIYDSHPDFGEISIIGDSTVHKRALTGINSFLKSICDFKEFPDSSHQAIEMLAPGKVEKVNDAWIVKQKMQIAFA